MRRRDGDVYWDHNKFKFEDLVVIFVTDMASLPWRSVENNEGVNTVVVNDEDISDFPMFMHCILYEKIGLDKGFFKVSLKMIYCCDISSVCCL